MNKRKTINQSGQKEHNLGAIIRELHTDRSCTRVKLAEAMQLTQASITKIIDQLIEWGVVSERGGVGSGVGRRAIRLHLNTENYHVVAARISRGWMVAAVYDMDGRLCDMIRREFDADERPVDAVNNLANMIRTLILRSKVRILSIGVAVPGPYDYYAGKISLISGFPGWDEINVREQLQGAFDIPVFIDQDANCGALAEMWYTEGNRDTNMVFVVAERGVGAGLLLNSSIYRGSSGFAGEFGHASINIFGPICECGNRGCLELYGSLVALENLYQQESFDPAHPGTALVRVSAKEILVRVHAGEALAVRVFSKTVAYLCFGVVGIINTLNPEMVVFADRMVSGSEELFLEIADQTFKQFLLPEIYSRLRVKACTLDGDPMLLGASALAFDQMLQTPSAFFHTEENAELEG